MTGKTELEATLVILSSEPDALIRELASLESVVGYSLLPVDSVEILDTYFDTQDGLLEARRLGLRVRQSGRDTLVTLKGQPRVTESGAIERLEIEAPFSEDAMALVIQELAELGVGPEPLACSSGSPDASMRSLGLGAMQARRNRRVPRLVKANGSDEASAELVIDSVEFLFGDRAARHYEVEVEAKGPGGEDAIADLIAALEQEYTPRLRRWPHDKLVTGKAVGELLSEGEAAHDLLDDVNNVRPESYDRIDGFIRDNFL